MELITRPIKETSPRRYVRKTLTWKGRRYEVRGSSEEEAGTRLVQLLEDLKQGERGSTLTVDQWFHRWMELYKEPTGLTQKSLLAYEEKYRCYIAPAVGGLPLPEVRDLQLQDILNRQAGRSFSHVTKLRMVLQEMFRQARRSRFIVYDPAEGLQLPAYVKGSHRPISEEERAYILAVAETHPAGLWVLTILYTGMRPGETAPLLWQDVDFERNEIHVCKALESGAYRVKEPKTAAGVRDIPIRQALRNKLWFARGEPEAPVFPSAAGRTPCASTMRRWWYSFIDAVDRNMGAEVEEGKIVRHVVAPDLTPYCLRHTFCTDLQRAEVPINVAKELMGHASISVTANIYTHRDQAVLHSNMTRLDAPEGKKKNARKS